MQFNLLVFLAVVTVIVALWIWRKPDWMGFGKKSLWDWLSLLAVPSIIGFATVLINASQLDIEQTRQQELSIQRYIDRISELSLDARALKNPLQATAIGRAQTAAVLQITDKERTGRVLRFLHEMGLLQKYAVSLEDIDLSKAELKGLQLDNMYLEGSNLRGADLENGSFKNVDFEEADLRGADMDDADFSGAGFENALMKGAELDHANLRGADLSLAVGLTQSQLEEACVDETTKLPAEFRPVIAESANCTGEAED